MPAFQVYAGTATEQRDARGPHDLVFGPDEEADQLNTLAPGIFAGGGGHPVMCAYGQFASLLLTSAVRLTDAGAPRLGLRLDDFLFRDLP